jgi:hypothetical protein
MGVKGVGNSQEVDMTTSYPANALDTERLNAVLPAAAAAWADGDLTDLELAAVCMAILRHPKIDLSCRETLERFLELDGPLSEGARGPLLSPVAA